MAKPLSGSKPIAPIAIVGGESLLGKDIREVMEAKSLQAKVKLITTAADAAILTEESGEPAVMSALLKGELAGAKVVVLAGNAESSRKAYELMEGLKPKPVIVDATAVLDDSPLARLRAPQVEPMPAEQSPLQVVAHPAAIALTMFLNRLSRLGPVRRCVAHVFEPASERGQPGLDELQQQTVGLLSFQKLKKEVFDTQVSFGIVPQYGEDAPRALADIELTIDRHLASLLSKAGTGIPMPSIRLIQAPVFHGYSFSVWVEFENNPGAAAAAKALAADKVEVRTEGQEPATNLGAVGQSGITVGSIAVDRNDPHACWFWVVADNLRIAAENAVEVTREFLG